MVKLSSTRLVGQQLTALQPGVLSGATVHLHKAPKSLDDVIQAGYLKALPKDFSLEACI
jgi:hypothetical protein